MIRFLIIVLIHVEVIAQTPKLQLAVVTTGLSRPNDIAAISSTEFLISQTNGQIRLIRNGVIQSSPFLDLGDKINDPTWEGIFGITLHPNYVSNGYVYVHYCRKSDRSSVFARYTRKSANPDQADIASELIYFTVPYTNPLGAHRSGRIGFGPDGYLYITTGDAEPGARGSVGDPNKVAQNLQTPYGKMLRIDVDHGNPYAIPATNPFADPNDGVPDELYALGLRNPWRWSFDRQTGDFWVGDVGQDGWEELDFTAANSPAPQNYGWPCFEGSHPYNSTCPTNVTYHMPLLDYAGYNSGTASSITGGFVYRGNTNSTLRGWYVYGDYQRGTYWTLKRNLDGTFQTIQQSLPAGTSPVSFGEGPDGELYVLSFAEGILYHLINRTITSLQNGNWTSPGTWTCSCVPDPGDDVIVSVGHTVIVNQPVQINSLSIKGAMNLANGSQVSFPSYYP